MKTQGRRIPDVPDGSYPPHEPGDYGRIGDTWWVFPPRSDRYPHPRVAMIVRAQVGINGWEIAENEDGTITIKPSIQEWTSRGGVQTEAWHGFLKAGVWEEC